MFENATEQSAPTTIFLARHGETAWNVERRFQGHGDSPLTDRGVEQARLLAERLAAEPLAAVYSSDLGRTMRTAELVAARHGLEVRPHPGLREIDTGEWTTHHRDDLKKVPEYAVMLDNYRRRPWAQRMPGGETVGEVQERALAALGEIAPRHAGQSIAVISHHVVVEVILAHALGVPLEGLWLPHRGGNCFVSVLEVSTAEFRPLVVYDGSHIGNLAGLDGAKGEARGDGGR